ncbi:MAG: hypothetical protein LBL00_02560 [Endomicrobium sp.]|jgi:hypothetical protein|nr:hypothetical protein [Endomicrobium sp.]
MKKITAVLFLFFVFSAASHAGYVLNVNKSIEVYQSLNQASLRMQKQWLCADTVVMPIGGIVASGGTNDEYTEVEPFFFQEFDYVPDTKVDILERVHPQNIYSLESEDVVFQVKYGDKYENVPTADYPKLVLTYPDNSTQTYTMTAGPDGIFSYTAVNLPRGGYKYEYIATNDNYIYNGGFYNLSGEWYITSRPRDFNLISPAEGITVMPEEVQFQWEVFTDEPDDILKYEFYIGMDNDKNKLKKVENGPGSNTSSYIYQTGLSPVKQYYWYMRIINKYGADLETKLFSFKTGGQVEKFYNAPNPFNPARGQQTTFVFSMPQSGTANLIIYSEYGDKVWESHTYNFSGDTMSSREIIYDGRDNSGRMLYNGTYIAVLTKKYSGKTKVEKCRILIIK